MSEEEQLNEIKENIKHVFSDEIRMAMIKKAAELQELINLKNENITRLRD